MIKIFVDPQLDDASHEEAYIKISQAIAASSSSDEESTPSVTIQELIVVLESSLTSTDDKERNRATQLIASLLSDHASIRFPSSVVHLFVVFFCRRLSDYPSIVPSLKALTALVTNHGDSFDPKYFDYLDIFQTIFKDIFVQALAQNIRQRVFELLNLLWDRADAIAAARGATEDIINGSITAFEGEKDPRCLVVSLQMIAGMIHGMGDVFMMPYSEKVFDCTACYFPITFQPPANDPFGITSEMLTNALQNCLCAHVNLLPHLLPFLCDQLQTTATQSLSSDLQANRLQALSCLLDVCYRFSPSILVGITRQLSSKPIGESLSEVLFECITAAAVSSSAHTRDQDAMLVEQYTLYTISQVCMLISAGGASGKFSGVWRVFVESLLVRICVTISEGGLLSITGRQAFTVACAMVSASTSCATAVIDRVVPMILPLVAGDLMTIQRTFDGSNSSQR